MENIASCTQPVARNPTLLLINPTSLAKAGAIESLSIDIMNFKPDVVVICETWFKPAMSDSLFFISKYNMFRKDRIGRVGGGIAIYVSCSYPCRCITLPDCCNANFEILCVICDGDKDKMAFILIAIYHPPELIMRLLY